jgi:hypothetical protein
MTLMCAHRRRSKFVRVSFVKLRNFFIPVSVVIFVFIGTYAASRLIFLHIQTRIAVTVTPLGGTAQCSLAQLLPIVPATNPSVPGSGGNSLPEHKPRHDGTDGAIISCNTTQPGYRVDMNAFWGSADSSWMRSEADEWLTKHGVDPKSRTIQWFAKCWAERYQLVPENYPDKSCFAPE